MSTNKNYGRELAKGDLAFGLSLMSNLGEGNVPISPLSVRTALSMLYEGAKGDTAKQIADVAFIPEDPYLRHEGFKQLISILNPVSEQYKLRCANGVWFDNKYSILPDFKDNLGNYRAQVENVDFERNYEVQRARINHWVSDQTEGKIPELFSAGSMNPLTVLVLANALYFKAPWENKFNPEHTRKEKFTLSGGERVEVDMMKKGRIVGERSPKFKYGEIDGVQMVSLPYEGYKLSKMIMLSPRGTSVKDLEEKLGNSRKSFSDLYDMLREKEFGRLEIPRHEIRGNYVLNEPFMDMGIERIFSFKRADLSGIGEGPLCVSKGVHQTYFKTDEEGSEGAAATGFAVARLCASMDRPVEFVADRPFLEMVVDNETGSLIFLNRIEDPRG
ncbi:MAG: serpin family protein [archaeon]